MLTEVFGVDWFDSVAATSGARIGPWSLTFSAADPIGIRASDGKTTMTLVAGRQIVTSERIEVHALGTRAKFADGAEAQTILTAIEAVGALTVLPWGVGKWLGGRGQIVEDILTSSDSRVYASDNGGRPAMWRERRFDLIRNRPLLRGSDPLPLAGEEYRVGEFGSWLEGKLSEVAPAQAFIDLFPTLRPEQVGAYGRSERLGRFCRNQLFLRLNRRNGW